LSAGAFHDYERWMDTIAAIIDEMCCFSYTFNQIKSEKMEEDILMTIWDSPELQKGASGNCRQERVIPNIPYSESDGLNFNEINLSSSYEMKRNKSKIRNDSNLVDAIHILRQKSLLVHGRRNSYKALPLSTLTTQDGKHDSHTPIRRSGVSI